MCEFPPTNQERAEELFAFLQGTAPSGCSISPDTMPHLTAKQAFTVIWYLGAKHWQVPDHIERCNVCGAIYDSDCDGACLDFGAKPYRFCGACENGPDWHEKLRTHSHEEGSQDGCVYCDWLAALEDEE